MNRPSSQLQRDCLCKHAATEHGPKCKHCRCKSYRADETPEWLYRRGIHAGEWQSITVPQLEALMRPNVEFKVRVWACGIIHTIGYKRRLAVRQTIDKKSGERILVPLAPSEIVEELNSYDSIGRANDQSVGKALRELEGEGLCRRDGRTKGNVQIYFYFRPLKWKNVYHKILVKSDQNGSVTDTNDNYLPEVRYSHFEGRLVKTFLSELRAAAGQDQILVKSDQFLELLEPALKLVKDAYFEALKLVRNDQSPTPPNKVDSSSRKSSSSAAPVKSPNQTTTSPSPVINENPDAQPMKTVFRKKLVSVFMDARKPVPTFQQCNEVLAILPVDGRWDYLAQLETKIDRVNGPGVLKKDAQTFSNAWQEREERRENSRKRDEAAVVAQNDEGRELARRILEDPTAPEKDKALARELLGEVVR